MRIGTMIPCYIDAFFADWKLSLRSRMERLASLAWTLSLHRKVLVIAWKIGFVISSSICTILSGVQTLVATWDVPRLSNAFKKSWRLLMKDWFDPYRPECHYMRGPGPKWREKNDPFRPEVRIANERPCQKKSLGARLVLSRLWAEEQEHGTT
jgi:hypothetical protein